MRAPVAPPAVSPGAAAAAAPAAPDSNCDVRPLVASVDGLALEDDALTALPRPPLHPLTHSQTSYIPQPVSQQQESSLPPQPRRRPQSSGAGLDRFVNGLRSSASAANNNQNNNNSAIVDDLESPSRLRQGHVKSLSGVRENLTAKIRSGAESLKEHLHISSSASQPQPNRLRGIPRRSTMGQLGSRGSVSSHFTFRRSSANLLDPVEQSAPSSSSQQPTFKIEPAPQDPQARQNRAAVISPYHGAAARAAVRDLSRHGAPRALVRRDSNLSTQSVEKEHESAISLIDREDDSLDSRCAAFGKDFVNYLPSEILVLVYSYLDEKSLKTMKTVSRKSRQIATDAFVWRTLFLNTYNKGLSPPTAASSIGGRGLGKSSRYEQDFEAMYNARQKLSKNWRKGTASATYLHGHTDSVYCVQFDETKIITGSRDRTIRVWTVDKPYRCLRVIGVPEAYETDRREFRSGVRLDVPEGHTVTTKHADYGAFDKSIYHVPRSYHNASILCLQYDDEICVTGSSDNSLIIWDIKTWQPMRRLRKHSAGVLDIALDKEKIISCSKDSTICIWDRATGRLLEQLRGHGGPVNAVQLRGNLFVSASGEGCAKLWNLKIERAGTAEATSKTSLVRDFWSDDRGLACVEFSEDCKYILAGGNDQVIYKFDTASGAIKTRMAGHESLVRSLYLDTANRRVVSGSYDFSLRVWDYDSGAELLHFPNWATSWMLSAKSDYRRIVSTSQDGRVCVVDFGQYQNGSQHNWDILKSDDELLGPHDQVSEKPHNDLVNARAQSLRQS